MSEPGGLAGLQVGHATDLDARTGCTVILGPFRASCDVRGFATGSRELDALSGLHLVPQANALMLTGGSAFGLAATEGVVAWLEERGIGYDVGVARVPIVPAAVIFDLRVGRPDRRPDAAMGRAACEDARPWPWADGRVGVGAGATVGKLLGPERAMDGGLGQHVVQVGEHTVLAMVVVNALGDVLDARGQVIAGARDAAGRFIDGARMLREGRGAAELARMRQTPPGTNTTLAVIATDAPVARDALLAVARMAGTALARRISPVNTPFDGDMVFALSTAPEPVPMQPIDLLVIGAAAAHALELAIERAVTIPP